MILLIFGIYAMISGNCPITRRYKLEGDGARWGGLTCIACSFGFFTIFSKPIMAMSQFLGLGEGSAMVLGFIFQFVALFIILSVWIGIFGNAYTEKDPRIIINRRMDKPNPNMNSLTTDHAKEEKDPVSNQP